MRFVFTTLLWVVLILTAAALAVFLLSLGFAGMGWLLSRILPLSLFEASVIAVLSGLGLAYVVSQIASARPTYEYEEDEDWGDEEDWDEEDWDEDWEDEYEEPIPFSRWRKRGGEDESADVPVVGRNDPCPCGSGRKYKYCHGKNK